jgi:hypothetical protein
VRTKLISIVLAPRDIDYTARRQRIAAIFRMASGRGLPRPAAATLPAPRWCFATGSAATAAARRPPLPPIVRDPAMPPLVDIRGGEMYRFDENGYVPAALAATVICIRQVRKTPGWPRSWANFRLLSLYSHWNAWANLQDRLGRRNTLFSLQGPPRSLEERTIRADDLALDPQGLGGALRARSCCSFALLLFHFMPRFDGPQARWR